MIVESIECMSDQVLEAVLGKLSAEQADLLIQGYPFTSFGRLVKGKALDLPPQFAALNRNWSLFWDVRVFAAAGEWHAWRDRRGRWKARVWLAKKDAGNLLAEQHYPLWGWGNPKTVVDGAWGYRPEGNGAAVWLPQEVLEREPRVSLTMCQVAETGRNGIAVVVDTVIRRFDWGKHE